LTKSSKKSKKSKNCSPCAKQIQRVQKCCTVVCEPQCVLDCCTLLGYIDTIIKGVLTAYTTSFSGIETDLGLANFVISLVDETGLILLNIAIEALIKIVSLIGLADKCDCCDCQVVIDSILSVEGVARAGEASLIATVADLDTAGAYNYVSVIELIYFIIFNVVALAHHYIVISRICNGKCDLWKLFNKLVDNFLATAALMIAASGLTLPTGLSSALTGFKLSLSGGDDDLLGAPSSANILTAVRGIFLPLLTAGW